MFLHLFYSWCSFFLSKCQHMMKKQSFFSTVVLICGVIFASKLLRWRVLSLLRKEWYQLHSMHRSQWKKKMVLNYEVLSDPSGIPLRVMLNFATSLLCFCLSSTQMAQGAMRDVSWLRKFKDIRTMSSQSFLLQSYGLTPFWLYPAEQLHLGTSGFDGCHSSEVCFRTASLPSLLSVH